MTLSPVGPVAYLTDVEGHWEKLADFARENPLVQLAGDTLSLSDGAVFVFGGDAIDRGSASRRVVRALLAAKRRYGGRVVLLGGNRDINKLRLTRELGGFPPPRAPRVVVEAGPTALLRWLFDHTMGARSAFAMRRIELEAGGTESSDEAVTASFLADLGPDGDLTAYVSECQLAYRHAETLFLHGAVTEESFGVVPGVSRRLSTVDDWVGGLNAFFRAQMQAYGEGRIEPDGTPGWEALVAYQAPVPGTRMNQASVVYGRLSDAHLNPQLPPRRLVETLRRDGVERVVVGHTPSGDSPSVLTDEGFQLVFADNSYGRVERGSRVFVEGPSLRVDGEVVLDGGTESRVSCSLTGFASTGPVGLRDAVTGRLVKGYLSTGELLLFRFLGGYALEQRAFSPEQVAAMDLRVPRPPE